MKEPVDKLHFHTYCKPCGLWCCQGENPYASPAELATLGVSEVGKKADGTCIFLEKTICTTYERRPLECRMFPFDIHEIGGVVVWVLWHICPAGPQLDVDRSIDYLERTLLPKYDRKYIDTYIAYHKVNEPEKYQGLTFTTLRALDLCALGAELCVKHKPMACDRLSTQQRKEGRNG